MKLIPLIATKESIDVKKGGVITYSTDTNCEPGIILLDNQNGDYGVTVINQFHPGGNVKVIMRPAGPAPVKKYAVGDTVALLAVF
jgi:hypothetical protein